MKNKKSKLVLVISSLLISLTLFASSAMAYVDYRVNSVTPQKQQQTLWCWAAVGSMLANYLGETGATQPAIVTVIYNEPKNDTGSVLSVKTALAKWNISSTASTSSLSFGSVISNIKSDKNMGATITYNTSIGHMLTIKGFYENTDNSTRNIYYIDPANAQANIMAYNNFVSNSNWTWVNSIVAWK